MQRIDCLAQGCLTASIKEEAKSTDVQLRCEDGKGRADPQIRVQLHPEDVLQVLEEVSAETRLAWSEGRTAPGHVRPIVLEDHPHAASGSTRPSKDSTSRV